MHSGVIHVFVFLGKICSFASYVMQQIAYQIMFYDFLLRSDSYKI